MDWYLLCHPGAEPSLQRELSRFGQKSERLQGACTLSASKKEALDVVMRTQVATRMLLAVDHGPLEELDLSSATDIIPSEATFAVRAQTIAGSTTDLDSHEIAADLGERIERSVDLSTPDYVVFVQVGSQAICGIDVAGDLSKRYYRVFTNSHSIKGTLAASVIERFAPEGHVLDPFGNTGEIAIEAALRCAGRSPLTYSKHQLHNVLLPDASTWDATRDDDKHTVYCFDPLLAHLRSCKKNAKLAGVEKRITFSKLDAEWLDVKFSEDEIGSIITHPPQVTKRRPEDDQLKELCYQAAYVLAPTGRLVVLCTTDETASRIAIHAKAYNLRLLEEVVIYTGQLPCHVVCYGL